MEEHVVFANDPYEVRAVPLRQLYEVVNTRTGILEESNPSQYAAIAYAIRAKAATEQLLRNLHTMDWPDPTEEDAEEAAPRKH